ncbi:MAG: DUF1579 domain-containing protein [Pirellulales bacterium]
MFEKPTPQHQWLDKLVGSWTFENTCDMGSDQPAMKASGTAVGHSLGGLWTIIETDCLPSDGGAWSSIMSLGYDPASGRYIGTFAVSMMSKMWHYDGSVDATGKTLVLDTEGPKFDGSGMTKYQDLVEYVSDDHWILKSRILLDDGTWRPFMESHHRRA